nr:hypothetical protein [Tanacetum cinerariifolium]
QKSVSPDIHSSSCGDQAKEQGDKAVNKDKGESPVVTITGFRDLNEEFAECINNSSNGVVLLVLHVAGPSNAAIINLEDFSHNADNVGAEADTNNMESIISMDVKSAFLYVKIKEEFWSKAMAKTINGEAQIHARVDGKKLIITEASIRRDLQLADDEGVDCLPNSTIFEQLSLMGYEKVPQPSDPMEYVKDEAVYKELGDSLVRAATTASSLEAEQDNGNINKTHSKATPNESSSQGTDFGGGPKCNKLQSDEDRMKLNELMELYTNLQTRVFDLEKKKTTQGNEIASLKRRVKKLEKRNRSRTHKLKKLYKVGLTARVESSKDKESLGEDASKHVRIEAIDAHENITLVNDQDDADMFNVNDLGGEEVFVAEQEVVSTATTTVTTKELTLAQALEALKTSKHKVKGIVIQEQEEPELVERKEKRAAEELIQGSTKKQKVEDDKETTELKQLIEIILNEEEVVIDAIPLAVKSSKIGD